MSVRLVLIVSIILALFILFAPTNTFARTWYVNAAGTGDAPTIQAGIDSATAGDVVSLADGTYTGAGNYNVDFRGKDITVRSESGNPADCIVDVGGTASIMRWAFRFDSGETSASRLEGITVRDSYWVVGAVWVEGSSPTITNCVFSHNTSTLAGGAIGVGDASPLITYCRFENNNAAYGGGAIYCDNASPVIRYCEFKNDSASNVGGAFGSEHGSPTLENCRFLDNWAGDAGGAIRCFYDDNATLTDLFLSGNEAAQIGGGMSIEDVVTSEVSGCTLTVNTAQGGGGMHIAGNVTVSYCTMYENTAAQSGGAIIYAGGMFELTNCTISENSAAVGGGMSVLDSAPATLTNNIIANSSQGEAVFCSAIAGVHFDCCNIYGNAGGDWVGCIALQDTLIGNFSADPAFCGVPGSGNFGLQSDSPCAPGNHPKGASCGLVGARPVDCGVSPVRKTSWSEIRSMFKK